ncbi:peptidylprolyl isomerase [Phenylobacterium sp.]|jgi:peptidyl-prolyl cis-trans isomerase C|uniref:peptidylprolyl isomerase n=1 Tax=Phenylobacterium sp. TaxID=1871053 RepID=UPI000C983C08|nr:peptidylprolyl isomerase [Phenylobacterium sp.]MAK82006.1 peptidylprolyl isomerase [Phenylobacterium sp.]|tara:strand:- start:5612 stop:6583 length:972 start_codon:yes stop_codon:yes gene_type:complete
MTRAKPVRFGGLAAVLTAVSLILVACGDRGGDERPPQPGDEAVARVDGKTVWASDVKREAVAQALIGEGEPLDISSDLFRRVLDEVIDQKLLAAEALKRNLDEDPVAQRRLAAARERILGDMLVESVVSDAVNENAIRGLYQEQLKLARQSEEIRARQILVATLEEGEAVKNLLATGASFEALAMERSTDAATRFNGGDLGYFTTDVMPEAYEGALKDAKAGDIVGPFEVEGGFAVVRIEDRRLEEPITLEAARPQIIRFLTYDQVRDLLEKLRGRAKVETLIGAAQDVPGAPVEPADAAPPAKPAPATAAPKAPAAKTPEPK